jgi:Mg2+/Co2+ transporter CorB
MTLTIATIVLLVLLAAFFAAAETALAAASRPLMYHIAKTGSRRARVVNRLQRRSDRLFGTLLLGHTLTSVLGCSLATGALIVVCGEAGIAYATLLMTLLLVIFAQILPKNYAFRRANHVALGVAPAVAGVVVAVRPVTALIEVIVRVARSLAGGERRARAGSGGAERTGVIAWQGEARASARARHDPEERAMLHSILDLNEVEVGQVMTHRRQVTMLNADDPPQVLTAQVLASPFSRFPLWREEPDNILGVLHGKDLLRAVHRRSGSPQGLDVAALAATPWFVPDATTLADQLQAFRRRREHFAIVVDEYGSVMGIVTLEDILEEIVGEIADEHDLVVPEAMREADGSFIVPGQVAIRDLNRDFGWQLPDEEAVTVAGLVLHEARRIPEVGETFVINGFRCTVLRRQRHQITAIRVLPPPEASAAAGGAGEP